MTAPAIPDELERILRRMRLSYLRKAAPDVLGTASRGDPHDDAAVQEFRKRLAGEHFPKLKMPQPFAVQYSLGMAMFQFHPRLFLPGLAEVSVPASSR